MWDCDQQHAGVRAALRGWETQQESCCRAGKVSPGKPKRATAKEDKERWRRANPNHHGPDGELFGRVGRHDGAASDTEAAD